MLTGDICKDAADATEENARKLVHAREAEILFLIQNLLGWSCQYVTVTVTVSA